MYEDEELSELSEEEDELAVDKKNHAGRTHKDPAIVGYNLQKALKPPRATTYTAQALYGTCPCFCIEPGNDKT